MSRPAGNLGRDALKFGELVARARQRRAKRRGFAAKV
jgi:hypothetical protein